MVYQQLTLFPLQPPPAAMGVGATDQGSSHKNCTRLGHAAIRYKTAASILTRTSGFMQSYDYSLNPYSGCSFACSYCYAAFFCREAEQMRSWGYWVDVKQNALALLQKKRKKPLNHAKICLSTVTDPYQPIEQKLQLTRALVLELVTYHKVRLVVQTRAPLVTRDIALFKRNSSTQINMTITTDDDKVRQTFEPHCPSISARLKAIAKVAAAGLTTCITLTPLLPLKDPRQFARRLKATGVTNFFIHTFIPPRGQFASGTRPGAVQLAAPYQWNYAAYQRTLAILRTEIPTLRMGKAGYAPRV